MSAKSSKAIIVLAFVAAAAIAAALGWWVGHRVLMPPPAPVPAGFDVVKIGESLPELRIPQLLGNGDELPYAGRLRVINFWASWCGPCIEEMPILDRFLVDQGANGVGVIGIALDDLGPARDFITRHPVAFPLHIEPNSPTDTSVKLGNLRGVLPYSVLIGADDRVLATRLGPFRDLKDLQDWVNSNALKSR